MYRVLYCVNKIGTDVHYGKNRTMCRDWHLVDGMELDEAIQLCDAMNEDLMEDGFLFRVVPAPKFGESHD